jgi:cytochrome b
MEPRPVKQRVWDLPTRLFHWSMVLLVAFAWWTGENEEYDFHLWAGYAALFALTFRLLWGLFGSSTARFSAFVRGPAAVVRYLRDRFSWPVAGHSPLGALSVVALLALLVFQIGSGLFAADEDGLVNGPLAAFVSIDLSDLITDLHEQAFNVLLALIVLHVAAILFYRLVLKKKLLGPMISGRAALEPGVAPMRPAAAWRALACAAAALVFTAWIVAGAPPFRP